MTTETKVLRPPVVRGEAQDAYGIPVPPPDTAFWARLVSLRGYPDAAQKLKLKIGACVYVICCDCGAGYDCGLMRAALRPPPGDWPSYSASDDVFLVSLFDLEYLPNGPGVIDYTDFDEGGVV